jgi:DNA-binding NarL/FixJ family response regulator
MTVLIIDEDPTVRVWLQHLLPCETRTAANRKLGLREAVNWQPSVILLDGEDEVEWSAVSELRRECPRAQVVIMVNGKPTDAMRSAIDAGGVQRCPEGGREARAAPRSCCSGEGFFDFRSFFVGALRDFGTFWSMVTSLATMATVPSSPATMPGV